MPAELNIWPLLAPPPIIATQVMACRCTRTVTVSPGATRTRPSARHARGWPYRTRTGLVLWLVSVRRPFWYEPLTPAFQRIEQADPAIVALISIVGVVGQPEGVELTSLEITAQDDIVPGGGQAAVLHPQIELIGVEVRRAFVCLVGAQHVGRGRRALADGVVPMLDPQVPTVTRVPG